MSDMEFDRQVDEAIHSAILEFDPGLPDTYNRSAGNLRDLLRKVEASGVSLERKDSLRTRIKSQLAFMAYEVKDYQEAEKLTSEVLTLTSPGDPDFGTVLLLRTDLLHILERHEEEIQEALDSVEPRTISGSVVVSLLAKLARRHPDRIVWRTSLILPIKAYVSEMPELTRLLNDSSLSEENPVAYVLAVADAVRQLSLARTRQILGEGI